MKLHIRNMVCNRCKMVVQAELLKLGLHPVAISLGEVEVTEDSLTAQQLTSLDDALRPLGFERVDDRKGKLIERMKAIVVERIWSQNAVDEQYNWSGIMSRELNFEYGYLSGLFSSVEGITLEQYIIRQKVERVKEWLVYDELTLAQIAWKLGYSSPAHLSSQFKRVTGLSPSYFRTLKDNKRKPIDQL